MPMRVLIVDDEPIARRRISRLLKLEDDVEVVNEVGSGTDAVAAIREQRPDLCLEVFLFGRESPLRRSDSGCKNERQSGRQAMQAGSKHGGKPRQAGWPSDGRREIHQGFFIDPIRLTTVLSCPPLEGETPTYRNAQS